VVRTADQLQVGDPGADHRLGHVPLVPPGSGQFGHVARAGQHVLHKRVGHLDAGLAARDQAQGLVGPQRGREGLDLVGVVVVDVGEVLGMPGRDPDVGRCPVLITATVSTPSAANTVGNSCPVEIGSTTIAKRCTASLPFGPVRPGGSSTWRWPRFACSRRPVEIAGAAHPEPAESGGQRERAPVINHGSTPSSVGRVRAWDECGAARRRLIDRVVQAIAPRRGVDHPAEHDALTAVLAVGLSTSSAWFASA